MWNEEVASFIQSRMRLFVLHGEAQRQRSGQTVIVTLAPAVMGLPGPSNPLTMLPENAR